jgi:hypothetical protein
VDWVFGQDKQDLGTHCLAAGFLKNKANLAGAAHTL